MPVNLSAFPSAHGKSSADLTHPGLPSVESPSQPSKADPTVQAQSITSPAQQSNAEWLTHDPDAGKQPAVSVNDSGHASAQGHNSADLSPSGFSSEASPADGCPIIMEAWADEDDQHATDEMDTVSNHLDGHTGTAMATNHPEGHNQITTAVAETSSEMALLSEHRHEVLGNAEDGMLNEHAADESQTEDIMQVSQGHALT